MSSLSGASNSAEPQPPINKPEAIFGITLTFGIISWLCVSFRLYTRLLIVRAPGWDDVFVVLYLLSTSLGTIAILLATRHGLGQHFWTLTPDERMQYFHIFYVANGSYPMSTTFVKLSLLCQYLRIYERGSTLRHLCIITIVVTTLWGLSFSFMAWFPCFPVEGFWNKTLVAKCYGYASANPNEFSGLYVAHSASNSVLDLIVLSLPVPLYFRSGTESRTRLGLAVLLTVGGIVGILSIWRLETLIEHRSATSPIFDPTWYAPISIVLAVLEVDIACICACVPVFWPVLSRSLNRIMVTKEVKITHESRSGANLVDRHHEAGLEHDFHDLHDLKVSDTADSKGSPRPARPHSRHDSEAELKYTDGYAADVRGMNGSRGRAVTSDEPIQPRTHDPAAHYDDQYTVALVDPLSRGLDRRKTDISTYRPPRGI